MGGAHTTQTAQQGEPITTNLTPLIDTETKIQGEKLYRLMHV